MKKLIYMVLGLIGIMGTLSVGVVNAENPDIQYYDSNISYTLNENESFTAGTITISDGTTSITILDRNLGATAAGTGCEDPKNRNACSQGDDAYGYHFQWGNNYGFKGTGDVLSGTDKATWNSGYSNSGFYGTTFIKSTSNPFDYWKDSVVYRGNHYDLWGGSYNDSTYSVDDNSWKINLETVKNRRGPCPEGFHVPSIGELMKVKTMIGNNASEIHSRLLIPYAGGRGNADALVGNLGFYTILWSSSPTSASDPNSRYFYLRDDYLSQYNNSRALAYSVRCFYNKYDIYCPDGQHAEDGVCIDNTMQVPCEQSGEIPDNASYDIQNVTITRDEQNGRSNTGSCSFICDGGYFGNNCKTTITHHEDSNISYILNQNKEFTGVGTITITDGTDTITILDRNLGATAAGTGCEGECAQGDPTYGYYFQWGNNYGFKGTGIIPVTGEKVVWSSIYSNSGYYGSTFITSTGDDVNNTPGDYWTDSEVNSGNHYDLWGGNYEDVINYDNSGIWKVTNATERKGPCPEGFHVPSYGELNKIKSIIENDANAMHNQIWISLAGGRQYNDAALSYPGYMTVLWSSSPSPTNQMSKMLIMDTGSMFIMEEAFRANGIPIRCFYNEYAEYPEPIEIPTISITGITLPVGGEEPTTGGISSLTEGINLGDLYRFNSSWDEYNSGFIVGQPYELYIPFTVASGYKLKNGFTATFSGYEANYVSSDTVSFQFIATAPNNSNLTVTHHTDSNISYKLNGDESFTGVGTITISDGIDTITILDRNLGASAAGTGCEDPDELSLCNQGDSTYGYHFQRGNNWGFDINDATVITNATGTQVPASEVNVGYSNGTFITGDNWIDDDSKVDMWGGSANDGIDNWKVTNPKERQGPCPEGFHVPSIGELLKMEKMMGNDALKMHEELLIPYAGGRDSTEMIPDYLGTYAYFWSSTPYSTSSPESLAIVIQDESDLYQGEGPRSIAISLRCFYNSYEAYSQPSNNNGQSGGYSRGGSSNKSDTNDEQFPAESQDNNANTDSSNDSSEGQTNTNEFEQAYEFAYENGVTTMDTIEKADMEGSLTRIAMAKMLSKYAINVLGKKSANVVVPKFKDITNKLDEEYDNGVTLAYQLGIMGINMPNNKFRPNDLVTRAEFATALSRMLFSTPDGNPYYSTHLAKLKAEGIITNDDPDLEEVRGYVMIMLMRSAM